MFCVKTGICGQKSCKTFGAVVKDYQVEEVFFYICKMMQMVHTEEQKILRSYIKGEIRCILKLLFYLEVC